MRIAPEWVRARERMASNSLCEQAQATAGISILEAMHDPGLFARWFSGETWQAWEVFLSALLGLPLDKEKFSVFRRHTGRNGAPREPCREGWVVAGRRAGKSLVAALVAVYLAYFRDYREFLGPGERATVMVIAADRRQARVVFRYIAGLIDGVLMLSRMVESRTSETINLNNRVTLEVHTASFRAVRGYAVAAAICDEVAFWRSEDSANPDTEILNGLRPGMATIPGALLAVHQLPLRAPWSVVGSLPPALRPGK